MTASHNLNQFCPFRTKQRISLFSEQVGQVYFVTKRTLITANQTKQLGFANLTSRIEENLLISNYNSPNLSELCQSLFLLFVKRFEDFDRKQWFCYFRDRKAKFGTGGVGSNDRWWREKLGGLGKTPGSRKSKFPAFWGAFATYL